MKFDGQCLCACSKDGVLRACDDMCGVKRGRESTGDTRQWWNLEMKEAIVRKKDAHKVMCGSSMQENMNRYNGMNNEAEKVFSKAMRKKLKMGLLS